MEVTKIAVVIVYGPKFRLLLTSLFCSDVWRNFIRACYLCCSVYVVWTVCFVKYTRELDVYDVTNSTHDQNSIRERVLSNVCARRKCLNCL